MHEALFGIQSGLGDNGDDSSRIDYLDGTKRTRLEIGHYVYQNYRYDACLDEAKVLGDIEMVSDVFYIHLYHFFKALKPFEPPTTAFNRGELI